MPPSSLKIVFAGTPEFAAHHLEALVDSGYDVCAVYTQPDRPSGRGKKTTPSAVKQVAVGHDIPVYQPVSLKSEEAQRELAALDCDIMVVVAYGLLLPKAVLDIPTHGCINVHGSILPRWRGAAPIQRAIEAGDSESGITIMQMDVGLDTGDMLLKTSCPIEATDTAAILHDRLCDIGPLALISVIEQIARGAQIHEKQDDSQSNYAHKIEKAEAQLDWQQSVTTIDQKIRAFNPFPICFTYLNGERLRIHRATVTEREASAAPGTIEIDGGAIYVHCGQGVLSVEQLQLPGKKAMTASEFLNGFAAVLTQGGGAPCFGPESDS